MSGWFFIAMGVQCLAAAWFLFKQGQPGVAIAYIAYGVANGGFAYDFWR
jgi:hypothetical protein